MKKMRRVVVTFEMDTNLSLKQIKEILVEEYYFSNLKQVQMNVIKPNAKPKRRS